MKRERIIKLLRGRLNYVKCMDHHGVSEDTWLKAPPAQRKKVFELCQEFHEHVMGKATITGDYWESVEQFLRVLEKSK